MRGASALGPPPYRDGDRLGARTRLHETYAHRDWFGFLADAAGLRAGERVLDAGCGPCAFWRRDDLPRVALTLLDRSPFMLARGVEAATGRQDPPRAVVGDLAALPFAAGAFDVVLALHVLCHVEPPAAGLREAARVLRPGGRAVLALNRAGNMAAISAIRDEVLGVREGDLGAAICSADDALAPAREVFARADILPFEEVMAVDDPDVVAAHVLSLPGCDGRAQEVEAATRAAFARLGGMLRAAKSQAAVVCGKEAA